MQNYNTPEPAPLEERLILRRAVFLARLRKSAYSAIAECGIEELGSGCFGSAGLLPSGRVLKVSVINPSWIAYLLHQPHREPWMPRVPGNGYGYTPKKANTIDGWPSWIAYVLHQPHREPWMPRVHFAARSGNVHAAILDFLPSSSGFTDGMREALKEFRTYGGQWEWEWVGNERVMTRRGEVDGPGYYDDIGGGNVRQGVFTDPWGFVSPWVHRELTKEVFHAA